MVVVVVILREPRHIDCVCAFRKGGVGAGDGDSNGQPAGQRGRQRGNKVVNMDLGDEREQDERGNGRRSECTHLEMEMFLVLYDIRGIAAGRGPTTSGPTGSAGTEPQGDPFPVHCEGKCRGYWMPPLVVGYTCSTGWGGLRAGGRT